MTVIDSVKENARNSFKPLETRENEDQTQWSEFSGLRRDIKTTANRNAVGCCFLSAKCRVQSAECRVQSAECKVQSAECRVQSVECRVQSAECRVQSAECRVMEAFLALLEKQTAIILFSLDKSLLVRII